MAVVTICHDFGAQENIVSTVAPSIFHEVMGPDATILVFWMLSCWGPAPVGPGIPKWWVASAKKKTDARKRLHRRGSYFLFLGYLSFYRINVTSPLSHHILHQILVSCSCQYFSFPCFPPLHSSRTFPITGFFLKCLIQSLSSMS